MPISFQPVVDLATYKSVKASGFCCPVDLVLFENSKVMLNEQKEEQKPMKVDLHCLMAPSRWYNTVAFETGFSVQMLLFFTGQDP